MNKSVKSITAIVSGRSTSKGVLAPLLIKHYLNIKDLL